MTTAYLPETAPFSPQQRAWLNGFFAAVLTGKQRPSNGAALALPATTSAPPAAPEEDFPWHDAALPLAERLALAEGRPYPRRLMAAMAQLNCGACGYLCQTYSEAIARGDEKDLTKCSPGGAETAKMLKQLVTLEVASPSPGTAGATATAPVDIAIPQPSAIKEAPAYTRDNPFSARLVSSTRLTHPDSPKDTRHVVIDLLDSGLTYEPGDSLGILPLNCRELVGEVLQLLGKSGGETVRLPSGRKTSLRHALMCEFTLGRCRPDVFAMLAEHAQDETEKRTLKELASADNPLLVADLAEVLAQFPSSRPPLADLLGVLAKLQPRLYSISSSQKLHPNEVHLTVSVVQFESLGRWRGGVASNFLGVRSQPGDEVRLFVQRSPRFRLPADPKTPVIMVGPGTGIAPFRAFLEEREAVGAEGKSWLFFGNQYIDFDFLYRNELSRFLDSGALTKLDLAFSRDTAEKVYVQHRMLENGAELWRWLEEGANFYVCGDAKRMAIDVDQALQSIVAIHGQIPPEAAKTYVQQLAKSKRYHKDVY
jgi:sulfite reductase (NADPH) flavoprotein alpha-component